MTFAVSHLRGMVSPFRTRPLFAVPLRQATDPARFELTVSPVRLVLGWVTAEDGTALPALDGGAPGEMVWDGPILYEETRERAEQIAKTVDQAERASVRDARVLALFERWDAWMDGVSRRVERKLDRLGAS